MSKQTTDDLLDEMTSRRPPIPVVRSAKQRKAAARAAAKRAEAEALRTQGQRLAQIVNLHIGGYSFADIAISIGATEAEVERLLMTETARYVRTQPALRIYVRNFVSEKYTKLLDNVWDRAMDEKHEANLDAHDRALKILNNMAKLHGAAAPTQTEVTVDAAPDAVERLVAALASAQGQGYDEAIFDVAFTEDVHEAAVESPRALEAASDAVENETGDDDGEL